MDFAFELATAADDGAIRRLLAENPVPGAVTLGYEREPDYFLGCGPLGDSCQVLVARHREDGALAAVACRALRTLFVNGAPQTVGYLGQLRVAAAFRSRWLVSAGFRKLRELHNDGATAAYLTTIISGNREAEGVLVGRPRRHFPRYRPLAELHTLTLPVCRRALRPPPPGVTIVPGDGLPLAELLAFWDQTGGARQFFPAWRAADFAPGAPLTRDFRLVDLRVALRGGRVVATLGLWDQSAYKQMVVRGYGGLLRQGRPLYNLGARLRGRPLLPPVGGGLKLVCGAFCCVADGAEGVFPTLLDALLKLADGRGHDWLAVGLCGGDPLLPLLAARPHFPYRSRLYSVSWDDGAWFHDQLDGRIPHVELAAL